MKIENGSAGVRPLRALRLDKTLSGEAWKEGVNDSGFSVFVVGLKTE